MNIIHLQETTSTNSFLREWSNSHSQEQEAVVVAYRQTKGRGQRGNTWESEPGRNITMSLLLQPDFIRADRQFIISQIVSLSITRVLSRYTNNIAIKWPNDIYCGDKKICGILIENDISDSLVCRSIVGIGLNVNQQTFYSDAPNPISLLQITGLEHDIEKLSLDIASEIYRCYYTLKNSPQSAAIVDREYAECLYRRDGFHGYEDSFGRFRAKINSVDSYGMLVLEMENSSEIKSYAFKEIKFLLGS